MKRDDCPLGNRILGVVAYPFLFPLMRPYFVSMITSLVIRFSFPSFNILLFVTFAFRYSLLSFRGNNNSPTPGKLEQAPMWSQHSHNTYRG